MRHEVQHCSPSACLGAPACHLRQANRRWGYYCLLQLSSSSSSHGLSLSGQPATLGIPVLGSCRAGMAWKTAKSRKWKKEIKMESGPKLDRGKNGKKMAQAWIFGGVFHFYYFSIFGPFFGHFCPCPAWGRFPFRFPFFSISGFWPFSMPHQTSCHQHDPKTGMRMKIGPPPPTQEVLTKDFCLQPGLEWIFSY